MLNEFRKIPVFIKRDFKMLMTYRMAFFSTFFGTIFMVLYVALAGGMLQTEGIEELADYGGEFIPYILVGAVGWQFLWTIVSSTSSSIRHEMMLGTFQSVLLTSTSLHTIMFSYVVFGCFFSLISVGILVIIGALVFGVEIFANASIFTLILILLSTSMMMGFAMIFGGITIRIKNIGMAVTILQYITLVFSGVFFPITVLPGFLQPIARVMPFYYSIEGLRKSMITSTPTSELILYVMYLVFFATLFLMIGHFILRKGLISAKKDGSLTFY